MFFPLFFSFTRLVNSTEGFVFLSFWPSIVCLRFLVGEASLADGARVQSKVETQASRRETLTGSSAICMVCSKTKARESESWGTNDDLRSGLKGCDERSLGRILLLTKKEDQRNNSASRTEVRGAIFETADFDAQAVDVQLGLLL